jgi:tetratricopeptide (TPR) repeat protein
MSAEFIRQAYIAIQNGDRITARTLLRRAIIKEPHNELAWYLLAQVIDKREHAIDCLEQVIKINPNNEHAVQALAVLRRERRITEPVLSSAREAAMPALKGWHYGSETPSIGR